MFLLDTNIVSELRKGERANGGVRQFAQQHSVDSFHLSVITIMELRMGVLALARKDAAQARTIGDWMDNQILRHFAGRILPVSLAIAERCAALHVPDRRQERDALIAATALEHGLTVITRNERDFVPTGVGVVNPWRN